MKSFMISVTHESLSPFPGHQISCRAYTHTLIHLFHQFTHCFCSVQRAYIPSRCPHLINPLPLLRSIQLSLTVLRPHFRFPNSQHFYGGRLSACRPTPNLEGQSTIFITPRAGWPSCVPRLRVPILVTFYDLYGLQWDYSFPRLPHGEVFFFSFCKVLHL
jgi:hypothetical protein